MYFRTQALVAALLCVLALADLPYGYYTFLRIVVCGVSAYGVYLSFASGIERWAITLGLLAVLFNPVIPIHLDRGTWAPIDLAAAAVLLAASFRLGASDAANQD